MVAHDAQKGSSESHCACINGVGGDVHKCLYKPEPI